MKVFKYKATLKVGNQIIKPIIEAENPVKAKAIIQAQYSGGKLVQLVRA